VTRARAIGRRRAGTLALAASLVVACQAGSTATAGAASARPGASPPGPAVPTLGPPPSPTPPDETGPVVLDPKLLELLPAAVNGTAITESVDEATQALGDPTLPKIASAVDAAVAADAGSGNLVYAWVARLRPDAFNDSIFRQWRDSYDEGACNGPTGIVGHAEATIDGRIVYVTSCTQGLHTYHVWLKEQGVLISASGIGTGRFGELLMDNLPVPTASPS
jgi:hypothetical protein